MTRFALIPLARLSVGQEGLIRHPFPLHPILTGRHTDLLRLIVKSAGIKHK